MIGGRSGALNALFASALRHQARDRSNQFLIAPRGREPTSLRRDQGCVTQKSQPQMKSQRLSPPSPASEVEDEVSIEL
jgi:hypothetical protein